MFFCFLLLFLMKAFVLLSFMISWAVNVLSFSPIYPIFVPFYPCYPPNASFFLTLSKRGSWEQTPA